MLNFPSNPVFGSGLPVFRKTYTFLSTKKTARFSMDSSKNGLLALTLFLLNHVNY
jgi:hypothetical protein